MQSVETYSIQREEGEVMRGSVAKKLRRDAYGDKALRNVTYRETNVKKFAHEIKDATRKDSWIDKIETGLGKIFGWFHTCTLVSDPTRRYYQELKRKFLAIPRPMRFKARLA